MPKYLTPFLFALLLCSTQLNAITFDSKEFFDSSQSNFIGLEHSKMTTGVRLSGYANSFEKIAADFNGDGYEDILSLGGKIAMVEQVVYAGGSIEFDESMALLLNADGEFNYRSTPFENMISPKINVVDIDKDGDLDLVLMNGLLAINDGEANFTLQAFASGRNFSNDFFTVDIDSDGDNDIVTGPFIYLNDGQLNFNEIPNPISILTDLYAIVDANNDGLADILVVNGESLQTWSNQGNLSFAQTSSTIIPADSFILHPLSLGPNNRQDLILAFRNQERDELKLFANDGQGQFSVTDFVMETGDIDISSLKIGKLYNRDADNDGDTDLWVSAIFSNDSCQMNQNLLLLYENTQEQGYQYYASMHSEGLDKQQNDHSYATVKSFPVLVDIEKDSFPDVVLSGEQPVTWLNRNSVYQVNAPYFFLSNASSLQFTRNIDVADFNNDGKMDIYSAAMYQGQCSALSYSENSYSTSVFSVAGKIWLNDGDGGFQPYASPFAGGNDFLGPHEFVKFVNLDAQEQMPVVYTETNDDGLKYTSYRHPMTVDPAFQIDFPLPTNAIEVANLNTTGKQEMVVIADTDEAQIMILKYGYPRFEVIQELEFGALDGEIKLADMDGDGFIDIVANTKANENSITIWFNEGNASFANPLVFSDHAYGLAVLDFNNDGRLDIFTGNPTRDIWLNQGNREFIKATYDFSQWTTPLGMPSLSYLIPKQVQVGDFNQDGKQDMAFRNDTDYFVFINESSADNISFYLAYSTRFSDVDQQHNSVLTDINDDGKMDFVIATNKGIKIYTQTQERVGTGLYYDPQFNGHGFSIEEIGRDNLFYSLFYSYNDEGKPQWFASINRYTGFQGDFTKAFYFTEINHDKILSYLYDYQSQSAIIDYNPQNQGHLFFANTKLDDPENQALNKATYIIGDGTDFWDIQPLIEESQRPENDLSGLWWAGVDDAGWGVSLYFVQRDESMEVVAILYFYDENSKPVWVIGQNQNFEVNSDISIDMKMINGYGREQNHVELSELFAGTVTINLKQASADFDIAGSLSMNIDYPDNQLSDNAWVREAIPIALFSKAKD